MTVHKAIEVLRGGISQKAFAEEIGVSPSALQKYETDRTPESEPLWRLMQRAESSGRYDLAEIFRKAWAERVGLPKTWANLLPVVPRDTFEMFLTAGLLAAFRNESMRHLRPAIIKALEESCVRVGKRIQDHQAQAQFFEVFKGAMKLAEEKGAGHWSEDGKTFVYYTQSEIPAHWQKTYITDPGVVEQLAELGFDAEGKKIDREKEK